MLSLRYRLTPREADCVCLVAEGRRDKEIAILLGLKSQTVRNHLLNARKKLGVQCRTQIALLVIRGGQG